MFTGILTASGIASRFGGEPKFLLPVGGTTQTLISRHVTQMLEVCSEVIITVPSKWAESVPKYDPRVKVLIKEPSTMPDAVLAAIEASSNTKYLIGLPDTYLDSKINTYKLLADSLALGTASLTSWRLTPELLGKVGQINSKNSQVFDVVDKDPSCTYKYLWGTIAFDLDTVSGILATDTHMGEYLSRLIESKIKINDVRIKGTYYDIADKSSYKAMLQTLDL